VQKVDGYCSLSVIRLIGPITAKLSPRAIYIQVADFLLLKTTDAVSEFPLPEDYG
jgi:hypothetical protein